MAKNHELLTVASHPGKADANGARRPLSLAVGLAFAGPHMDVPSHVSVFCLPTAATF